jgi:hypothetical protein
MAGQHLLQRVLPRDNAAGLGASHQTGWTGLIADVIRRRHGTVRETVGLVGDLIDPPE